jgi:hypothetical protein
MPKEKDNRSVSEKLVCKDIGALRENTEQLKELRKEVLSEEKETWEKIKIIQDSANTYEIRRGNFSKGGIFPHDLSKFINDIISQEIQKAEERARGEERDKMQAYKNEAGEACIALSKILSQKPLNDITEDETENLDEAQTMVKGLIKWDACSHIYFGDKDGYLHLCGGRNWFCFQEAIKRIWEIAIKELPQDHSKDMFDIELFNK